MGVRKWTNLTAPGNPHAPVYEEAVKTTHITVPFNVDVPENRNGEAGQSTGHAEAEFADCSMAASVCSYGPTAAARLRITQQGAECPGARQQGLVYSAGGEGIRC